MNILYLSGSNQSYSLATYLRQQEDEVIGLTGHFDVSLLKALSINFIVSHGYRYIIPKPVIDHMKEKIINLHISYLPWNRGADPNFWSWVEDTPKGVTIHKIDQGVDTGNIIAQKEVIFREKLFWQHDFLNTYIVLQEEMEKLFYQHWPGIKQGDCLEQPQKGEGSFHLSKDIEKYRECMPDGWLTPIAVLLKNIDKREKEGENEGIGHRCPSCGCSGSCGRDDSPA